MTEAMLTGPISWKTMTLDALHEKKLREIQSKGGCVMDYLLQAASFLSRETEDNKMKYMEMFFPDLLIGTQAPPPVQLSQQDAKCGECGSMCVLCVVTNTVVCRSCGLVENMTVLGNTIGYLSFDQMRRIDRKKVHFYNRCVHFRTYVRRLTAEQPVKISEAHDRSIRAIVDGYAHVDPRLMEMTIRRLNLTKFYLVHVIQLCKQYGKYDCISLGGMEWFRLSTLFRRVSKWWHFNRKHVAPKRKSFLSYSFVFYQLAHNLSHPEWTKDVRLPKHYRTLMEQFSIWEKMCKPLRLKAFPPK